MSSALVIGNGAAGTFASWLLARKGWEVTLVGRGTPSAAMSTGCLRSSPKVCPAEIAEFLDNQFMPWTEGVREGLSKIGTSFRCWMSPRHSTWGEGEVPKSIALVGLEGHPSMHVRVASAMLNKRGLRARPVTISGSIPSDAPLSTWFKDDMAWEALTEELQRLSEEVVLLPAFVQLQDYHRLDLLERRCGRRILEAISPLGTPGQRLADLMLTRAREAGAIVWDGRKVGSLDVLDGSARRATVIGGRETHDIAIDAVVVATGGPLVNGLILNGREIEDPYRKFQVVGHDDALKGGYRSIEGRLSSIDGGSMNNVVGAGDCLYSGRREYGSGLTEALETAYLAVKALEGA